MQQNFNSDQKTVNNTMTNKIFFFNLYKIQLKDPFSILLKIKIVCFDLMSKGDATCSRKFLNVLIYAKHNRIFFSLFMLNKIYVYKSYKMIACISQVYYQWITYKISYANDGKPLNVCFSQRCKRYFSYL